MLLEALRREVLAANLELVRRGVVRLSTHVHALPWVVDEALTNIEDWRRRTAL